jgi:hypothetical protein
MDTNRARTLRRISGAGLALGVVSAALVALPTTALAAAAPAFGTTWVTSQSGNSVTELSPTGAVVGSPIKGASTGLADPQGVVSDSAGHVFVANLAADSITEYANGASGNVAPVATISGSQTGLSGPTGLALSGSMLWVTDANTDTLEAFTAGADGNVLPIETISGSKTTLDNPVGIFAGIDFGESLWVVNDPTGRAASVAEFDASGPGNQKPEARIAGSKTGLSDPRAVVDIVGKSIVGRIAVANAGSDTVTEYGDFPGGGVDQAPAAVISGAATKLAGPAALGLDAVGRLTVANADSGAVLTFANGAHGDQAPTRTETGLTDPGGTGVLASAPGTPTAVTTTPANHALLVSWHAPANTGGGILGYQVVVEDTDPGGGFAFGTSVNFVTTKTHITEKHLKNGHRYFVSVFAVNEVGDSPFSTFRRGSPATTPGAPRAVKLTPHSDELTVAWKAPKHNGGRKISRYTVQFASCTIGAKGCHAPSISVKGTRHGLRLKGLSAGTAYHVVITARNSQGVGRSSKPVTGTPAA